MKDTRPVDLNPFCPICNGTEESCLIIHKNIRICVICADALFESIPEPTQLIENEKVY